MTIQIEEGKFYKRADGSVHGPARRINYKGIGPYHWALSGGTFTDDGRFYNDQVGSMFDLVAEVPAPVSDQHAAETVEGKPDVEDDGFITRDTPEWAAAVEQEAAEDRSMDYPYTAPGGIDLSGDVKGADEPFVPASVDRAVVPGQKWRFLGLMETQFFTAGKDYEVISIRSASYPTVYIEDDAGRTANHGRGHSWPLDDNMFFENFELSPAVSTREPMTKAKMLDAAKAAVADRGLNYGTPEDNFKRICALWNKHLENRGVLVPGTGQRCLDTADVALMMVLLKVARLENQPNHMDSWTDIAGYAACGAELMDSI